MGWTPSRQATTHRMPEVNGGWATWLQRLSSTSPRVEAWATRDVGTCAASDSLVHAMEVMWERDCGCVPVIDDRGRLAGVLTDRDVAVAAFTRARALSELRVGDTMATLVYTCRLDEPVSAALARMGRHQVRRLPVVDASGRLVGIFALSDVLRNGPTAHASVPLGAASVVTHTWQALRRICQPRR